MVPVVDRASQSCLDRYDDVAGIPSSDTSQAPKPDRKTVLRARCRACSVRRHCRVWGNVYLAGCRNRDPSGEVPHQALQVLDAKCSCTLVDSSFPRNSDLRSLVYDLVVRDRFLGWVRNRCWMAPDGISTIGGLGPNRLATYPSILMILQYLSLALRLVFGSK